MYDKGAAISRLARVRPPTGSVAGSPIEIIETDPGGAGKVTFIAGGECVVIRPNYFSLPWLAQTRCADGAIIELKDDGADLHLVELKSTMSSQQWEKAYVQLIGMYERALALRAVIGIPSFSSVKVYISYTDNPLDNHIKTNPYLLKPSIGKSGPYQIHLAWINQMMNLLGDINAVIVRVPRGPTGEASINL